MNKKVLIGAIIGAVGVAALAAGYFMLRGGASAQRALAYVPADTVIFAGSAEPVDVRKYFTSSQWVANLATPMQSLFDKTETKNQAPSIRFMLKLYTDYLEQLRQGPDHVIAYYGLTEKSESAMYAVGAVPVIRFYLRDPAALIKALANAEQDSGFTPTIENNAGLELRRYPLQTASDGKAPIDLIVAKGVDFVVITFDSPKLDEATRALALGLKQPPTALARAKLDQLAKTHGLNNDGVGYFDFVELGKALVDPNTRFSQQLQALFGDTPTLAPLRTPACQREIPAFVAHVPRLVGGMKSYKASASEIEVNAAYDLEIANSYLLKSLAQLRGVIPRYLLARDQPPAAWVALAIDIDQVAGTITSLVHEFSAQKFECAVLVDLQASVTQQNLAGLMMLGMAKGVKGVSGAIYAIDIDAVKSGADGLDAIITLSASDPMTLWQMASKWLPTVTLPADGTPVDVPLPTGRTIKVALLGKHLVAYVGDKSTAAAQKLKGQDLSANGLFGYGYDYALFGQFMALAPSQDTDKDRDVKKLFEQLSGLRAGMLSDIDGAGWHNEMHMRIVQTQSAPTK